MTFEAFVSRQLIPKPSETEALGDSVFLFEDGEVRLIGEGPNEWRFRVKAFTLSIVLDERSRIAITCPCPQKYNRFKCVHMFALLRWLREPQEFAAGALRDAMANDPKKYHYSKYLKEAWSSTRMVPDDPPAPAATPAPAVSLAAATATAPTPLNISAFFDKQLVFKPQEEEDWGVGVGLAKEGKVFLIGEGPDELRFQIEKEVCQVAVWNHPVVFGCACKCTRQRCLHIFAVFQWLKTPRCFLPGKLAAQLAAKASLHFTKHRGEPLSSTKTLTENFLAANGMAATPAPAATHAPAANLATNLVLPLQPDAGKTDMNFDAFVNKHLIPKINDVEAANKGKSLVATGKVQLIAQGPKELRFLTEGVTSSLFVDHRDRVVLACPCRIDRDKCEHVFAVLEFLKTQKFEAEILEKHLTLHAIFQLTHKLEDRLASTQLLHANIIEAKAAPAPAVDDAAVKKARLEVEIAKLQAQLKSATPPVKPASEIPRPVPRIPWQTRFAASLGRLPKNLENYIRPSLKNSSDFLLEVNASSPIQIGFDDKGDLYYTCTCYYFSHYSSMCEHMQATALFIDRNADQIPAGFQAKINSLPSPSRLHAGDAIFRLRARMGIAHLSVEDSLARHPVAAERKALDKRFASEFARIAGPKIEVNEGFLYSPPQEPRAVEWHSTSNITRAQLSGRYFGLTCNCSAFGEHQPPCGHMLRMIQVIDRLAVNGRGVLPEEDAATILRLGLKDWTWDAAMKPQPWQEAGLSPYEFSQIKHGASLALSRFDTATSMTHPTLGHIYHRNNDVVDDDDDAGSGARFALRLNDQTLSIVQVKDKSLASLKPRKLAQLLGADPELARIAAPIFADFKRLEYAEELDIGLNPATAPMLNAALRLGKLHLGDSLVPAQCLDSKPYRLGLELQPVKSFFRLRLSDSLGGQPLPLSFSGDELYPWGMIRGNDWMPIDIGLQRIECRELITRTIDSGGVFDRLTCHRIVEKLQILGGVDSFSLPPDWALPAPLPPESCILELRPDKKTTLSVHPFFVYGELEVPLEAREHSLPNGRLRLFNHEIAALQKLSALGDVSLKKEQLSAPLKAMPAILAGAVALGWSVRAEGKITRKGVVKGVKVKSGIDWLAVEGGMNFDGQEVELVDLIRALRKKEQYVTLADGSRGWIDPEAARRLARLAALGDVDKDSAELRFPGQQAFLLDVLLNDMGEVHFDEAAAKARDALKDFSKFEPMEPPKGFGGELRPYQKDGLGWLALCRQLGLGACLADDMGLGKTVQMLAHLENLRLKKAGLFIVVCPASLLFNWEKEAKKFTPKMKVLVHQGLGRAKDVSGLKGFHLIVLTYATLRNDILWLKDQDFACVVLDEAQSIKNASSASAKAARLLKGEQRLALTGTPVENHLDDLWSLFEFLNPGLLGSSSNFGRFSEATGKEEGLMLMAKALRPLILRRTKSEVATDLPPLSRQILWCEMEEEQQIYYDKLLAAAKADLLDNPGLEKKNSFLMLEKLLRLRQAACSPALCDKRKKPEDAPSAKLDALMPMLEELLEEKHQVLIFSQFTEFLAIAAKRLEAAKIPYAYLDGGTKDRGGAVDDFQLGGKNVFLISLKAGGTGLNLVAADYVFLLDPWWNPAVEQQAIDRAHRIGQSRPVTAYRLVAKGSIEEKILELQDKKRALADTLLGGEGLDLGSLQREDLEYLLG